MDEEFVEELIRGDSCIIEFDVKEDITMDDIDTITLTARTYADGEELFTKNKEDFTLEGKVFSVEIKPEDTQELALKKLGYDIEIVLTDGTTASKIGAIKIVKDYTHHVKAGDTNGN